MTERTVAIGSLPAVNRLLIGLWQLSSPAWGSASKNDIISSMKKHYDAGMRTFDGDAEADFRRSLHDPKPLLGFTKWCPQPGPMTRSIVETAMRDRLRRMNTTTIDCLQFHWWDYSDKRYSTPSSAIQFVDLRPDILLKTLKVVGDRHNVSIANVATRFILERPVSFKLSQQDYEEINKVLANQIAQRCLRLLE
ncbi:NADP-dependent oxidoreductase domain-containing protein [Chytridium lagenaria]|nr:NADP-dependent oxidoreductase domain-containing protein [Chytridium lagenaria]